MDMVNDGKDPILDTPQAVKEALLSGKDLYNTETGEFWWLYNATDSIATATIHLDDPNLLAVIDNPDFDLYEDIVGGLNYTGYITDSIETIIEDGEEKAERETLRAARIEKLGRHRTYREEHGFAPDTVAAFAHEHPECCHERVSRKGNRVLSYIDYLGHEQVCPIERIRDTHLYGFDATDPGSFDEVIEGHQLLDVCEMRGDDRITLGGEAQAMKAASAEMADGTEKHNIGLDAR